VREAAKRAIRWARGLFGKASPGGGDAR
jgi:hypothetical protein